MLHPSIQYGLAFFYFVVVLLNLGFVLYYCRYKKPAQSWIWLLVALGFLAHSLAYLFSAIAGGPGWVMADWIKQFIDALMNPVSYFVLSAVAFAASTPRLVSARLPSVCIVCVVVSV